jgi:hypothetical protein
MSEVTEKYLYPIPEQSWGSLVSWIRDIRKFQSVIPCPWDEEEYELWMRNLWFSCWKDVHAFIEKKGLKDRMFAWGIGKYWSENGNCTMAVRIVAA